MCLFCAFPVNMTVEWLFWSLYKIVTFLLRCKSTTVIQTGGCPRRAAVAPGWGGVSVELEKKWAGSFGEMGAVWASWVRFGGLGNIVASLRALGSVGGMGPWGFFRGSWSVLGILGGFWAGVGASWEVWRKAAQLSVAIGDPILLQCELGVHQDHVSLHLPIPALCLPQRRPTSTSPHTGGPPRRGWASPGPRTPLGDGWTPVSSQRSQPSVAARAP